MQKLIKLHSNDEAKALYGNLDQNVRQAEKDHRVKIVARNDRLKIMGDKKNVEEAARFFIRMLEMIRRAAASRKREGRRTAPRPRPASHLRRAGGSIFFIVGK